MTQYVKDVWTAVQSGERYVGNDVDEDTTYYVSPVFLTSNVGTVTIIDSEGNNTIQLANGLEITSSVVTDDEAQIVLSNGTILNIRGADTFSFDLTDTAGVPGTLYTFTDFVADVLGIADGETTGGAVTVGDGTSSSYTLTSSADEVVEGDTLTFTVTASEAVTEDTTVTFQLNPGDSAADDQGTNDTNLNDFSSGAFNPTTVTILAGATTATFTVTADNDGITELAESFSVDATVDGKTLTKEATLLDGEGSVGTTFELTTNEDSGAAFTGTDKDDTFDAPAKMLTAVLTNTLQNVDNLNGGGGTDTLNVTLAETVAVATALTSIETINVRFANKTAGLDLSNATGVTSVNVAGSTTVGTVTELGTISTLSVKNQTQNIGFDDSTATTLALTFDTVGNFTTPTQVLVDLGATAASKATVLNIMSTNSNVEILDTKGADVATSATIAATGTNSIELSDGDASITTLTVTGTGSVALNNTTLAALKTLTATDNSGGVAAEVDATAVTVNTGAGSDFIEYTAALDATAKVALAGGSDTFMLGAASAKGALVDGGAGADTDTLAITNGAWLDANAKATYLSFENLEIGGGTGKYTMSNLTTLTSVTVGAALTGASDILDAAAGTTLTVNSYRADLNLGKNLTYDLKDDTALTDTVSLTLNGDDSKANSTDDGEITVTSFVADGIETFNIVSSISNIDSDKKVTDYEHIITAMDGDAVTTINVSGNAALDLSGLAATTVTKIDAHTMTGALDVDASNSVQAVEFLGGTGNDDYTGTNQGDTINADAGADAITLDITFASVDTLIVAAGDSLLNAKADGHDVITNFGTAAGAGALDIIDLGAFGFTGTQSSALASKGALANSVVDGTTLTQADFFLSGAVDRGVAIGTNGGSTYVFIDVNKDGDFTAADDIMIELAAVIDVTLSNFGF